MKKASTLMVPIVVFGVVFLLFKQVFGSGPINPMVLGAIIVVSLMGATLLRPKNKAANVSTDAALALLGDFSKEAFSYDENLSAQFESAMSDYLRSMPKSAVAKLEKLQAQCKNDADTYAVNVALGMTKASTGDYEAAIKLYNKAVILHPSAELADAIGSAHQRIGELDAAIDSYEFALDLNPEKIDIRAKVATAYVGDGKFETAIDHAQQVLDIQPDHASALATIAICHGCMDHTSLYEGYTAKAVEAGYSEQKITSTVPALKKKFKKTLEAMKD